LGLGLFDAEVLDGAIQPPAMVFIHPAHEEAASKIVAQFT
jgi:hypothetical protein